MLKNKTRKKHIDSILKQDFARVVFDICSSHRPRYVDAEVADLRETLSKVGQMMPNGHGFHVSIGNAINHMGISINGAIQKCWFMIIYNGKSHLQMDDDWGYPYFRKPSYGFHMFNHFNPELALNG